jgi:serine/threonine-protein kinase HipA
MVGWNNKSGRFLLTKDQAQNIIQEMEEIVRQNWYSTMRSVGVSERDCELLGGAFVYPGFN